MVKRFGDSTGCQKKRFGYSTQSVVILGTVEVVPNGLPPITDDDKLSYTAELLNGMKELGSTNADFDDVEEETSQIVPPKHTRCASHT